MGSLQRPSFWYESWMVGKPEAPATSARKRVAEELLLAIKDHVYDTQTLDEITLLINHECLCHEVENSESSRFIFRSALDIPVISQLAEQLSSCGVKYVNASSHVLRELQLRALLSVVAWLHLRGVTAHQADSHARWQEQINQLYQDLVWLPEEQTGATQEAFRRAQCSYLLSLVAAQQFVKARPRIKDALEVAGDLMQLGVVAVNIALGFGIGNMNNAVKDLYGNFTRLLDSTRHAEPSDNRYHDLFKMQGLTRIAVALEFYSRIGAQSVESHKSNDDLHTKALKCSRAAADVALEQVLRVLNSEDNGCFEADLRRPSKFREQLSAVLDRGPASLDRYNYFYGILDCATQLASITDPERYPAGFEERMRLIVARSRVANFRWKALEVLLANPSSRSLQSQLVLTEAGQRSGPELQKQLRDEMTMVLECLGDSTSISITESSSSRQVMDRLDWIERNVPTSGITSEAQKFSVPLPRGSAFHRIRFSAAGLSTECSHAYFLNEKMVLIYSLSNLGEQPGMQPVFRHAASELKYAAAALSERFVVLLVEESRVKSIRIFRYDGQMIDLDTFGMEADRHQWNPNNLITIHETDDRTWIAVGGWVRQEGAHSGSIKMYCIHGNNEIATLTRQPVSFTRPKPNPLTMDLLKTLAFSPDGKRLVCATNNNRILVWRLSNNARPDGAPFILKKDITTDMTSGGISSTSLFESSLSHPYVLCTTLPSLERVVHKGEWSFVSPIGSAQVRVHERLVHDLVQLRKSGSILAGAVCPCVGIIALVERLGKHQARIVIMPMVAEEGGGLSALNPVPLGGGTLAIQDHEKFKNFPTALRFQETRNGYCLVAVDIEGKVVKKAWKNPIGMG
ncbi:hypothetical protein EPUS_04687 [Endocarpon pusillum Z07020]|uniref:Uncharacterized protein n=1 Tax=Endocarpon pusillum (strain Z07020 / HMAS-L-300199) TaxID=1263415 RepID=U1HI82_ENDPU|nr:uncharacterized protein EPUS_04687 [Endocarpon pusillum Z07020]ERF68589.1 hypothetical protein EPUS_04687 [Endocarpon pusillum Z07020]